MGAGFCGCLGQAWSASAWRPEPENLTTKYSFETMIVA